MHTELLKSVVHGLFPKNSGLVSAFGYGSVVVPQYGRTTKNSQLDLILIVNDPIKWHITNLQLNPTHYSRLASFGKGTLLKHVLANFPHPAVYYNPFVTWHDCSNIFPTQVIKYGVVSLAHLTSDLNSWCDLYVAGRLHKPVVFVPQWEPSRDLKSSLTSNLRSALAFSLLQLDLPLFKEDLLYRCLASISYRGDWRLWFGEDRRKIDRLIAGESRRRGFRDLYLPLFTSEPFNSLFTVEVPDNLKEDLCIFPRQDGQLVESLVGCLPLSLCQLAVRGDITSARRRLTGMVVEERRERLLSAAASIVRGASYRQTLLGLFSAGIARSFIYSLAKFRKMLASLHS